MDKKKKTPKPLQKPLPPFERYSKQVEKHVTDKNPHKSAQDVAIMIGDMWTSLDNVTKWKYNNEFIKEKQAYDAKVAARKARLEKKVIVLHAPGMEKKDAAPLRRTARKSIKPNKDFPGDEQKPAPKVQVPKPDKEVTDAPITHKASQQPKTNIDISEVDLEPAPKVQGPAQGNTSDTEVTDVPTSSTAPQPPKSNNVLPEVEQEQPLKVQVPKPGTKVNDTPMRRIVVQPPKTIKVLPEVESGPAQKIQVPKPGTEKIKEALARRIVPQPPKANKIPPEVEQDLPPKVQYPKPEPACIMCGLRKPHELRVIDPYGARNHMKVLPAAIEEVFSVAVDARQIINTKSCIKCFNVIMRAQAMKRHYLAVMDGKKVEPISDFVKYSVKMDDLPTVLPKGRPTAPNPPEKPPTASKRPISDSTTNLEEAASRIQNLPSTSTALCRSPSVAEPQPGKPQILLQFTPTTTEGEEEGETSNTDGANKKVVTFTLTGITVKQPPSQDHPYCNAMAPAEQAEKILKKCGIFRHTMPTSVTPRPEVDTVVEAFRRNKEVRTQIEKQILSELSSFCNRMNSTMPNTGPSVLRTSLENLPKTDVIAGCILEMEQTMPFLLDILKTLSCASHLTGPNTMRTVAMMYAIGMHSRNGQFNAMQYINTMALLRYSGVHLQEVLSKSSIMITGNGRHILTSKAYQAPSLGLVKSEGVKLTRQRMDNLVDRILRQQNFPVPKTFVPYPIKQEESPTKKSKLLRSGKKGKLMRIKREQGSKRRRRDNSNLNMAKRIKREAPESGGEDGEPAEEEEEVSIQDQETQSAKVPARVRGKKKSRMAVEDYLQTRVISGDTLPQDQNAEVASPMGSDCKENNENQQSPKPKRTRVRDTPKGRNTQRTSTTGSSSYKTIRQQLIASQDVSETQIATRILESNLGLGANGENVSSSSGAERHPGDHEEHEVEICWESGPDQEITDTTEIYVVPQHGARRTAHYHHENPIVLGSWKQ